MPTIPFDPTLHQKVRYTGTYYIKNKNKLFVVHLKDYDFDKVRDDEMVIIHSFQYGIVNYNKSDKSQQIFVAKKSELTKVGAEVKE
jgi:hypothetical protein